MKKLLIILLSLFILTGCSKDESTPSIDGETDDVKDDVETISVDFDIWGVNPIYTWNDIDFNFTNDIDNYRVNVLYEDDLYGEFEKGGVAIIKNDLIGYMNGNGEVLTAPHYTGVYEMPIGEGLTLNCVEDGIAFGQVYKDYTSRMFTGGWGGTYAVYYWTSEGRLKTKWTGVEESFDLYKEFSNGSDFLFLSILDVDDKNEVGSDAVRGYVYSSENENRLLDFINDKQRVHSFADGVLCISNRKIQAEKVEGTDYSRAYYVYDTYKLIDLEGNQIGETYEDAYNFYEGYAPVKMNGKWGYIDKQGNQVIDFIFDKATPIVDGKAWVIYEGRCGRLNILNFINNNVKITSDLLNVSSYDEYEDETIYLEIIADSVKIRNGASTSANDTSYRARKGVKTSAYKKVEAEVYTWYYLGTCDEGSFSLDSNKEFWIADSNGEWIKELN